MQNKTNAIEYKQTEAEENVGTRDKVTNKKVANQEKNGGLLFCGVRGVITNPIAMCNKIDKMFGSGGEAIVHYMWFESGLDLFETMIKSNCDKSREKLLRAVLDSQPDGGWGDLSLKIVRADPPMVNITVGNPPVKTLKGSQKHIIGSFWAGVLSRYFNRQLSCKNFGYDEDKDEFSCTITI